MGIQEILTYTGPLDAATGQRVSGGNKDRREFGRGENTDLGIISSKAKSLYEAEQIRKFDIVRERIKMGYYMKKEVLDQVIDTMMKEFGLERTTQTTP
jgi:hypothetical protein